MRASLIRNMNESQNIRDCTATFLIISFATNENYTLIIMICS